MRRMRFVGLALIPVLLCLGPTAAEASFFVRCVMKARVIKVLGPVQDYQVKARFKVTRIVSQGGYSSTWCDKYRRKKLTRKLYLSSKKTRLKKGKPIRIEYTFSHGRKSGPHESWTVAR